MTDEREPLKIVPIAHKAHNCAAWSPEQCIAEFLDDIRSAKIAPRKLMILWFEETADGSLRPHRWFANVNTCEEIAMLELGKHIAIDGWRG